MPIVSLPTVVTPIPDVGGVNGGAVGVTLLAVVVVGCAPIVPGFLLRLGRMKMAAPMTTTTSTSRIKLNKKGFKPLRRGCLG